MKYEFMNKPSHLQSRDSLELHINTMMKQEERMRREKLRTGEAIQATTYTARTGNDFELLRLKNFAHFTDHRGNYITKSGHMISDFAVNKDFDDLVQPAAIEKPTIPLKAGKNSRKKTSRFKTRESAPSPASLAASSSRQEGSRPPMHMKSMPLTQYKKPHRILSTEQRSKIHGFHQNILNSKIMS